ncbi:MAG TPA: hypothetical protein VGO93_17295, partial [Candidatus Xenobia bacterium]
KGVPSQNNMLAAGDDANYLEQVLGAQDNPLPRRGSDENGPTWYQYNTEGNVNLGVEVSGIANRVLWMTISPKHHKRSIKLSFEPGDP